MSKARYTNSAPDRSILPKFTSDTSLRTKHYGKILPMEEPGFLARLFGRR